MRSARRQRSSASNVARLTVYRCRRGPALRLHRPRRHPARARAARCSATPRATSRCAQARALEACHRAGVEVVIMSGRREAQVHGRRPADRPDLLHLRGRLRRRDRRRANAADRRLAAGRGRHAGREDARRAASRTCSSSASPGRLEWHSPWHTRPRALAPVPRQGRRRRGQRAARRARPRRPALPRQRRDRPARWRAIDGPAHAYHLVPGGASKAKAVAFHMRARGYAPEECIAVGDSIEDLDVGRGRRPLLRRRQRPRARPGAARGDRAVGPTSRSPRAAMGDGFYEAVVSTLAERR